MAEVLAAVDASRSGAADEGREQVLRGFERQIGFRRHAFAREGAGVSHLVTLTSMAADKDARMPVRRVTWSIAFPDAAVRDDLFAWLATRVDRWDDWGRMAYDKGAEAFGRHLLVLIVASRLTGASS